MTLVELLPWLGATLFFLLWAYAGVTLASEREDRHKEREWFKEQLRREVAAAFRRGAEGREEMHLAGEAPPVDVHSTYKSRCHLSDGSLKGPKAAAQAGKITCRECGESFANPDIREPDDDLKMLDYHCPFCHWKYARFPRCS